MTNLDRLSETPLLLEGLREFLTPFYSELGDDLVTEPLAPGVPVELGFLADCLNRWPAMRTDWQADPSLPPALPIRHDAEDSGRVTVLGKAGAGWWIGYRSDDVGEGEIVWKLLIHYGEDGPVGDPSWIRTIPAPQAPGFWVSKALLALANRGSGSRVEYEEAEWESIRPTGTPIWSGGEIGSFTPFVAHDHPQVCRMTFWWDATTRQLAVEERYAPKPGRTSRGVENNVFGRIATLPDAQPAPSA